MIIRCHCNPPELESPCLWQGNMLPHSGMRVHQKHVLHCMQTISPASPTFTSRAQRCRPAVTAHHQLERQQQQQQHRQHSLFPSPVACQAATRDPSTASTPSAQDSEQQPSTSGRQEAESTLLSFQEAQQIAAARGLHLSLKTLGPVYRIVCRDGGEDGPILGATEGFVCAPIFGLMHCDTLQIFTRGLKGEAGDRIRRNPMGLGLLLGGAVFSYGRACGCRKAEILAINDDDAWHERLVRYYSYFGFKAVCKVGGRGFFTDLPHLLVWGGEGTRMDADISEVLARWTPALRQSAKSRGALRQGSQSRIGEAAASAAADGAP